MAVLGTLIGTLYALIGQLYFFMEPTNAYIENRKNQLQRRRIDVANENPNTEIELQEIRVIPANTIEEEKANRNSSQATSYHSRLTFFNNASLRRSQSFVAPPRQKPTRPTMLTRRCTA